MSAVPDLISDAQTTEEQFLRHIFVRDQMAEWSKRPLVMARADGVCYWDVTGKRYLDALSGIYVVSVGHNNRRVIDAIQQQLDTLHFSPPMHGTNPVAVQLANLLAELAPGDLVGGQVPVRRLRGDRGGHQAGPPVSPPDRIARQVQDHQPLSVLARLDARLAVGLGPQVAQDRQRTARPRLPARLSADLLSLSVRQELSRLRHHLRHAGRQRHRDGRSGHGGRDHGRADRPHRRHHRSAAGVSADPARDLRPAQHPADLRRDHHRRRPHRPAVRGRDVRRDAGRALHGQGAERRLRAAVGDDLPPADRRRVLGADRRRIPASSRGTPSRAIRFRARPASRCCARSWSATCAATPASGRAACAPGFSGWRASTASSATSAARGCCKASSSCAIRRRRAVPGGDGVRRAASAGGRWRTGCCAASIRTGSRSARRWS